ncbi:MAG: cell division protein FtsZ [Myxococcales bacterium]|nr:cell division protein FtsZ [Myxococcales bacterium]
MDHLFEFGRVDKARLRVIGVGGGGGNAVNNMARQGLIGVELIAANTDAQALDHSLASTRLVIGSGVTKGLGAGAEPQMGYEAAMEDRDAIAAVLRGADMVFITAGMGGGTGTGAAPVIAQIAREEGALTVGVVTKPFAFEGKTRRRRAEAGLAALAREVDTLIVIPNQQLLAHCTEDTSFIDSLKMADQVLFNAVQGISDVIKRHGMVNVDFADVRTVMSIRGVALMGTGVGFGPRRALDAAQMAISSPLLENVNIVGARGVLINITGGVSLKTNEVDAANRLIEEASHPEVNLIFGVLIDETLGDEIRITVIATGLGDAVPQYCDPAEVRDTAPRAAAASTGLVNRTLLASPAAPSAPPFTGTLEPAPARAFDPAPARAFDPAAARAFDPAAARAFDPAAARALESERHLPSYRSQSGPSSMDGMPPANSGIHSPLLKRARETQVPSLPSLPMSSMAPALPVAGLAAFPSVPTPVPSPLSPPRAAPRAVPPSLPDLSTPAFMRREGRQVGEAKKGSDFWEDNSIETLVVDAKAPRFTKNRED